MSIDQEIDPEKFLKNWGKLVQQELEKNEEMKAEIEKYRETSKDQPTFISQKQYSFEGYFTAEQLEKLAKFLASEEMKQ